MVPFVDLKEQTQSLKPEVLKALEQVMDECSFCLGPAVERLERQFAELHGAKHAVAVNTGTSALHLALLAAGVGPGDEVITCPMTFVATAAAICYTGATPVFVDADPQRYTLDPKLVKAAITPRTKAIVPVHLYGQPADLEPLLSHGIPVVEDACQAHLAEYRGRKVGTWGLAGGFSFYPGKNLGAYGEGGMLLTQDDQVAEKARQLRDWGQTRKYHHDHFGFNYRMDGFQGAVLGVKLPHLQQWTKARQERARFYDEALKGLPLQLPKKFDDHVYHLYPVLVENRDEVQKRLQEKGVQTGIHYPIPVHQQKAYKQDKSFPVSERIARTTLSLPMYPELRREQQEQVVEALKAVL